MPALNSCFSGDSYTANYTSYITFEINDSATEEKLFGNSLNAYYSEDPFSFYPNDIIFNCSETGGSYNGFALSQSCQTTEQTSNVFSVCSKTGAGGSKTFAVHYENESAEQDSHSIEFSMNSYGTCAPKSCMVNNTAVVVSEIKDGAMKFGKGDWLKLTAKGYMGETLTGSSEIMLAEFTEEKDSVMTAWSEFDLSKLGNIQYIDFEVTSSKDEAGMSSLRYFCMDNFIASIDIAM